jgi:hypothetical protein
MSRELVVPPAAQNNEKAFEIVRCWVLDGGAMHCSINALLWDDPRTWGIALADLAGHLARAFALEYGRPVDTTLADIRAGFEAELDDPSDEPTGGFVS